ncbi:epithelial sodium channel subunit delta isoform X6 [Halichoerus grypus]|uniref:amiloride-sensitive sodium channel subunit delta isoform X5 n=1 Tax=Halichoerus grypus TaxID=9711 RepID=UPI001659DFEE|nr:amiloride-sensitive sodium channel subunit delta isoform X5 [Halichoerus grypus]
MEAPAEGGSSFQVGATAHAAGGSPTFREAQRPLPPLLEGRPRERLVELHTSFRELFTFFCANATIHGAVRLVCSSQNGLKTASWGLLLVGALGVFCWQFGLLLAQYWRHPVIMTVSVHSELRLFPAVTLCDMNPHRPRSARYHLQVLDEFAQENIRSLYKFNSSENRNVLFADARLPQPAFYLDRGIRLQRLSQPGGQSKVGFRLCNSTGGDCFYRAFSSAVTAVRQWYRFHYVNILALTPPAREDGRHSHGGHFVFSCRFDGQDCQARHFQTFHHPTYGSCHTFSGVSAARHPGISHGISLVLRAGQQDHLPLLSTEAGIKVMIHGHDHTPFLEHQGFSVRPGTETTIGIREDEVHRLGGPYGRCTKGGEGVDVQLLYDASYTLQACLVSCFQQLMVETCSCGYYFYPLPSGAEYCSFARHPAWGETTPSPHPGHWGGVRPCQPATSPPAQIEPSGLICDTQPPPRSLLLPPLQGPGDPPASLYLTLPQALQGVFLQALCRDLQMAFLQVSRLDPGRAGQATPQEPEPEPGPQEQRGQGEHLLPGAQLPYGGRDARLLGAPAAFSHGQPLEPVVRLIGPLRPGAAGAAARRHSPHAPTGLPLAPQGSGVPARGSHGAIPHHARSQPVAH